MQRQSETVIARLRSSQAVEASVTLNGADVGHKLDERFVQFLAAREGEPPRPPAQDNLLTLRDHLSGSRQHLASLDNQHVENVRKFIRKRNERDRHVGVVYDQLGISRRTIDDLFEPGSAFKLAGIQSPISRNAEKLLQQSDLAIERLKSPDMALPPTTVKGIKVDPKTLVEGLEPDVERLRTSNKELHEARRAVQKSRKLRNEAREAHDRTFLWSARTLEGYYQLAGEDKLAQEIRPSTRRPGRRAVDVAGDGSGGSSDSSDDAATEQTSSEATVSDEVTAVSEGDTAESASAESATVTPTES